MKKVYVSPEMDVEVFSVVEVMTSSEVEDTTAATTQTYQSDQSIDYVAGDDD